MSPERLPGVSTWLPQAPWAPRGAHSGARGQAPAAGNTFSLPPWGSRRAVPLRHSALLPQLLRQFPRGCGRLGQVLYFPVLGHSALPFLPVVGFVESQA